MHSLRKHEQLPRSGVVLVHSEPRKTLFWRGLRAVWCYFGRMGSPNNSGEFHTGADFQHLWTHLGLRPPPPNPTLPSHYLYSGPSGNVTPGPTVILLLASWPNDTFTPSPTMTTWNSELRFTAVLTLQLGHLKSGPRYIP